MGILPALPWRKKKDWEVLLENADEKIRKNAKKLKSLNDKEKRIFKLACIVLGIPYIISLVVYMQLLYHADLQRALSLNFIAISAHICMSPILLRWVKRILTSFFAWRRKKLETAAEQLSSEKAQILEDLKVESSYYKTKFIIDRFETNSSQENSPALTPPQLLPASRGAPCNESDTTTVPQQHTLHLPAPVEVPQPIVFHPGYYPTLSLRQGTVVNKIINYLLGEYPGVPGNSLALICRKCHVHNGLVGVEFSNIEFKCLSCGHENHTRLEM